MARPAAAVPLGFNICSHIVAKTDWNRQKKRRPAMTFHRRLTLLILAGLLACAVAGNATALAPFIDLQERGLSAVSDGHGLMTWDHTTPVNLTVNVGGNVRFALLYWAGRERPCNWNGSTCTFTQPYKDQQMIFNGTPLTGTVIGTESQPTSAGGPILNIGYFSDVTAQVAAAGPGSHSFTFTDGDTASNLWRLDGVSLFVAYTDGSDSTFYRLMIWDNLDFAYGDDPTPGETQVTSPVTFGHGAFSADRAGQLWLIAGAAEASRPANTKINQSQSAHVTIQATDGAGNVAICDPILLLFARGSGQPPKDVLVDVARTENKVTIHNGRPGFASLELRVNGVKYKVTGLRKGETRTVDISKLMTLDKNTISLLGRGPAESWAEVTVWDGGSSR